MKLELESTDSTLNFETMKPTQIVLVHKNALKIIARGYEGYLNDIADESELDNAIDDFNSLLRDAELIKKVVERDYAEVLV